VVAAPVRASTDAAEAAWHPAAEPPRLAFDHAEILALARDRLRAKVRYQPVGFELLPERFTLSQLQHLYEVLIERPLDKRNFRKRVLEMGILADTGQVEKGVAHRAARLYRFDKARYDRLVRDGFNFEL
jgi:8-oxo-dGTP diphosphatase